MGKLMYFKGSRFRCEVCGHFVERLRLSKSGMFMCIPCYNDQEFDTD